MNLTDSIILSVNTVITLLLWIILVTMIMSDTVTAVTALYTHICVNPHSSRWSCYLSTEELTHEAEREPADPDLQILNAEK